MQILAFLSWKHRLYDLSVKIGTFFILICCWLILLMSGKILNQNIFCLHSHKARINNMLWSKGFLPFDSLILTLIWYNFYRKIPDTTPGSYLQSRILLKHCMFSYYDSYPGFTEYDWKSRLTSRTWRDIFSSVTGPMFVWCSRCLDLHSCQWNAFDSFTCLTKIGVCNFYYYYMGVLIFFRQQCLHRHWKVHFSYILLSTGGCSRTEWVPGSQPNSLPTGPCDLGISPAPL